ncbi:MAG: VanW family protein [Bacillota bacterium]
MSDRFFRVLIVCLAVVILTGEVVEKAYAGGGQGKDGEQLEQVRQVIFAEGVSCCWINGQATGIAMSLAPYTANGRLMVAVQDLCRALAGDAYTINWDEHNQKMNLTLRGLIFNLRVGQSMLEIARICPGEEGCAHKQEESRLMDASPALRSVFTGQGEEVLVVLPGSYIVQALGYSVEWDPVNRLVICWPEGGSKPVISGSIIEQILKMRRKAHSNSNDNNITEVSRASINFTLKSEDPVALALEKNALLNAQIALKMLNNQWISPGQIFSFNRVVGPRTISRGFVVSRSIVGDGKKYRYISDVGGGVCRAATVLHQAVARVKGVKIIERHRHVLPVPYAATGQDAAVWYGKQDYRFINKRAKPLLIKAWWDGEAGNRLIVALYENISP